MNKKHENSNAVPRFLTTQAKPKPPDAKALQSAQQKLAGAYHSNDSPEPDTAPVTFSHDEVRALVDALASGRECDGCGPIAGTNPTEAGSMERWPCGGGGCANFHPLFPSTPRPAADRTWSDDIVMKQLPGSGGFEDSAGITFETKFDLLMSSASDGLGFCVCGDPRPIVRVVVAYLEALEWGWENAGAHWSHRHGMLVERADMSPELFDFLAYFCDQRRFTEHGGSVGGAWIEDRGRSWLKAMLAERRKDGSWPL